MNKLNINLKLMFYNYFTSEVEEIKMLFYIIVSSKIMICINYNQTDMIK
jgi:hypothetical protein